MRHKFALTIMQAFATGALAAEALLEAEKVKAQERDYSKLPSAFFDPDAWLTVDDLIKAKKFTPFRVRCNSGGQSCKSGYTLVNGVCRRDRSESSPSTTSCKKGYQRVNGVCRRTHTESSPSTTSCKKGYQRVNGVCKRTHTESSPSPPSSGSSTRICKNKEKKYYKGRWMSDSDIIHNCVCVDPADFSICLKCEGKKIFINGSCRSKSDHSSISKCKRVNPNNRFECASCEDGLTFKYGKCRARSVASSIKSCEQVDPKDPANCLKCKGNKTFKDGRCKSTSDRKRSTGGSSKKYVKGSSKKSTGGSSEKYVKSSKKNSAGGSSKKSTGGSKKKYAKGSSRKSYAQINKSESGNSQSHCMQYDFSNKSQCVMCDQGYNEKGGKCVKDPSGTWDNSWSGFAQNRSARLEAAAEEAQLAHSLKDENGGDVAVGQQAAPESMDEIQAASTAENSGSDAASGDQSTAQTTSETPWWQGYLSQIISEII